MKRGRDDGTVADRDRPPVPGGEHVGTADRFDSRCTDKHCRIGSSSASPSTDRGFEAVFLSTEGVSLDGDVDQLEFVDAVVSRVPRGDDQPGAGRKQGLPAST